MRVAWLEGVGRVARRPRVEQGTRVSMWRWGYSWAPCVACVLLACAYGCSEADEAEETEETEEADAPLAQASGQKEKRVQPSRGACSPEDREAHVHDPNLKFIGQVRACSKETWANKAKNVACLVKALPSLSKGCAGCFADMARCALSNCKAACLFSSTSDRCGRCANSNCQPSLVKCTGVAARDLP